jgi:hypothetical protein
MKPLPTGFYPFWFWNDTLTDVEIRWQIAQMAAQGVRGFFIHSRQGLKDPAYLSEAFFDRVDTAVAAAREHGLVVHLYDEYPYPSGVAGGMVTLGDPRYLATELIQRACDLEGGVVCWELPPAKVLALLAFPLNGTQVDWEQPLDLTGAVGMVLEEDSYQETGLTSYNQKRYFANRPHPVLQANLSPGRWRVIASLQRVVEHHKYWNHFSDVLNPQAVQRFIELTHERYQRRLGDQFGKTVQWIFTDEVMPGWSTSLPESFQREYGRDLLPLLPALQDPTHPQHAQLNFDLHRLKLKRFCETFEEPISSWCRSHHLAYAAEKPSLRFAQLRYQDIPGCEPGHVKAGDTLDLLQSTLRGNAKATACAAYFYAKDGALDECYHSLGWSATLEDVRWMADAQLLLGIRYLVPHGFFYSTHNLRKHDAPATLFFQAPYWPLFHQLSERVEQIGQAFEGTWIDGHLALVDPTAGLPTLNDRIAYERLLRLLMGSHIDFHIVDTDVLESGRLEAGRVILRDVAVGMVLIPPMSCVEPPLAAWLERFVEAGGKVVYCGAEFEDEALLAKINSGTTNTESPPTPPSNSPSGARSAGGQDPEPLPRPLPLREGESEGMSISAAFTAEIDIPSGLLPLPFREGGRGDRFRSLSLQTSGTENPALWSVQRRGPDKTLWLVLNTSGEAQPVELEAGVALREIPLEMGASSHLEVHAGRAVRLFQPFEACLFEAVTQPDEIAPLPVVTIPLGGDLAVRPLSPNLVRLYDWQLTLLDEKGDPLQSATVQAVPLANQLEQGKFRFTPRLSRVFGTPPELSWPELHLRYTCTFQRDYPGPVELVLEPGSIVGAWSLRVNDSAPLGPGDFQPTATHVRGSLGISITDRLRPGLNMLQIDLTTAQPDGGLLNPLYLAGEFGVALEPLRLTTPIQTGGFEQYRANRLPYYAGVIEYQFSFELAKLPAAVERLLIRLAPPAPFHEACEVSLNASAWHPLPWSPYQFEIDANELHIGRNDVTLRVYTTLLRSFEGQEKAHSA